MSTKYKVTFVDLSDAFHDRHPIYCLSAYLKENSIETSYVGNGKTSKMLSRIKEINPDLLLYSAYSRDISDFIGFDKAVKKSLDIKSIIGGPGPTFDWKFLSDSTIDALCLGEGEDALVNFIKNGFTPSENIIARRDDIPKRYLPFLDLDRAPFPDRELVYKDDWVLRDMPSKQFLSGRGCPYMCTYCHNNIQNKMFKQCGPIIRKKSVDYLLDEIKDVQRRYPLKLVVFQDDTFILKKEWFFEFCERFPKEIGLSYTCNIRASLINEDMVKALKDSNCVCTYWSIESGNDFIRNKLLKRQETTEHILTTGHLLNKYRIAHRSGGIMALPGETFEQILETLELNIKIKPQFGFSSIFIPFPGLELTNYALEHHYLSEESANNLPKGTHVRSALNFSEEENLKIQKLTFLYPLFVSYPKLFYNKKIYSFLFKLPKKLLFFVFNIFSGYKQSQLYKVKTSLFLKIAIIWRFIKNPF